MSDTVSYLSGDTIHRDHLQWPTILVSEIDTYIPGLTTDQKDSGWPVDITLTQIMAMMWRVKKWSLTGSASVNETISDSVPSPFTDVYQGDAQFDAEMVVTDENEDEATTESDLVSFDIGAPFHSLGNGGTIIIPGDHVCDWQTSVNGGSNVSSSFNANSTPNQGMRFPLYDYILFDSGTGFYSPPMFGPSAIIGATIGDNLTASLNPKRTPVTNTSGVGSAFLLSAAQMIVDPVVAPSFIVPMQLSWRAVFQAVTSTYSGAGSVTDLLLQATEFWPFKTSTGLPVYDVDSGAQINSPFA